MSEVVSWKRQAGERDDAGRTPDVLGGGGDLSQVGQRRMSLYIV